MDSLWMFLVFMALLGIHLGIDRLIKSLQRDSAKMQSLLAEIRDRLDK